jgi:hypothetical protein
MDPFEISVVEVNSLDDFYVNLKTSEAEFMNLKDGLE